MSILASIDIEWAEKVTVSDIISRFKAVGWNLIDSKGNAEYLPLHDDDFSWKEERFNEDALCKVLIQKHLLEECVGVVLWWRNTDIGVSLLIFKDMQTSIILNVNRQTLEKIDGYAHTDVNWYIKNVIMELNAERTSVSGYVFSEDV